MLFWSVFQLTLQTHYMTSKKILHLKFHINVRTNRLFLLGTKRTQGSNRKLMNYFCDVIILGKKVWINVWKRQTAKKWQRKLELSLTSKILHWPWTVLKMWEMSGFFIKFYFNDYATLSRTNPHSQWKLSVYNFLFRYLT